MKKPLTIILSLILCILVYPFGIGYAFCESLARWFRNFNIAEVYTAHRRWKTTVDWICSQNWD